MNRLSTNLRGPTLGRWLMPTTLALIFAFILTPFCLGGAGDDLTSANVKLLYNYYRLEFTEVPDLSVQEYLERSEREELVLVDNRSPAERAVSIIPGAISEEDYNNDLKAFAGKAVVVYCTIGGRSGDLAKDLGKRGVNAYNLAGGVLAWAHEDQLFFDGEGRETKNVHMYGPRWNLLPPGYEPVY